MKQPKFKIGDKVSMRRKTLYGETEGEIIELGKDFQELDRYGNFMKGGLVMSEREIKYISLPFKFDGETLTIDYPQRDFGSFILKAVTTEYKFSGYSYTVKTPKINTLYYEKSLRKI
jgi:hypothetical protein